MNSEKIQNTKVEVPKGKNLNCKDYMNMLLTILKEEVNYSQAGNYHSFRVQR